MLRMLAACHISLKGIHQLVQPGYSECRCRKLLLQTWAQLLQLSRHRSHIDDPRTRLRGKER
eukprot:CAMPEP_0119307200 /NCGR_PEP_ID=MMETSP1333-20130426/7761_1 /TAXON_ID=418940 /ORGANISM="Scyphosphaera apsteinii, Strain RCC1455" /LENGTH=61 /DNA_ID=CAMNT_0007310685 /DNA_START=541 /DNA_END=726 /DNA_ORIENTATION=+